MRLNKYRAKPTKGFPSKLEASLFEYLSILQKEQIIRDLKRQQTVVLQDGDRSTRISWRVDFSFIDSDSGQLCFAEAKGFETETYRLKLKLWRKLKPYRLDVYKGSGSNLRLVERVEP